jgi:hypothetical protein
LPPVKEESDRPAGKWAEECLPYASAKDQAGYWHWWDISDLEGGHTTPFSELLCEDVRVALFSFDATDEFETMEIEHVTG